MKAVLLDAASLGDDVDLTPIRALVENLDVHQLTSPEQTRKRLTGATIALTNKVVIDAELIDALPELKLICVLATGTNNIDMAAAERRGIVVRNVSAYGTASVAQHTLMLMLALAARLPLSCSDSMSPVPLLVSSFDSLGLGHLHLLHTTFLANWSSSHGLHIQSPLFMVRPLYVPCT